MLSTTANITTRGAVSFVTWKVAQIPGGQQVLTSTVKVIECRERKQYANHNVWGFLLHYYRKLIYVQIYTSRGAFSC